MTLTRRDLSATVSTALAVLVFAAAHEGWSVPLVGDSYRWAAAAIFVLGMSACAQGNPLERANPFLVSLGVAALALTIATLISGSLTLLSLLTADTVLLWALSTVGHLLHHAGGRPVAT